MITSGLANGKKPKATKKAPPKQKEEAQVEIIASDSRHELFCQSYIKHKFNATRAYMEVYEASEEVARKNASRLLTNADILERIGELSRQYLDNAGIDAQWVIQKLRTVVERCMEGTPIYDLHGNPTGFWRFDTTATLRALEMIGNFFQMFAHGDSSLPPVAPPDEQSNVRIAQFISLHTHNYELRKNTPGDTERPGK